VVPQASGMLADPFATMLVAGIEMSETDASAAASSLFAFDI
jgi:hypothetical protein